MSKLLLITPPYHCGVVEVAGRWLPLNLLYVATAARRAGWEVRLHDAMSRFDELEDIAEVVRRFQPDMVGIPAITATTPATIDTATLVKGIRRQTRVRLRPAREPSRR